MRIRLAKSVIAADYAKLQNLGTARLHGALTEDIQSVRAAANSIVVISIAGATVSGALVYLGCLSPLLLAMIVLPTGLAFLATRTLNRLAKGKFVLAFRTRRPEMDRAFGACIAGTTELKLNASRRSAFLDEGLKPAILRFHESLYPGNLYFGWSRSALLAGTLLTLGVVMFAWPRLSADAAVTAPAAALAILYLPGPILVLVAQLEAIGMAGAVVDNLRELGLSLAAASREDAQADSSEPVAWRRLELRGVTYRYRTDDDREFTLGPVDFSLRPGEVVFVVGGNGSGKTTLMNVLAGLYVPEQGEIFVNDELVTAPSREAYRQLFAAVFSDYCLFDRVYGVAASTVDAKGADLLRSMALEEIVHVKNGAFATTDLSQGQRKRLALVVAVLQNRPVYILDEWAAEQDPQFKEIFYTKILPDLRAQGKTIVLITHDDRYFGLADRVIHLAEGKVHHNAVVGIGHPAGALAV